METKNDFRCHVRAEKKKYTPEELCDLSKAVWEQVESLPEFQQAETVALYWSLPDEVYSHEFVQKWCSKKRTLLPVMLEGNTLELREYKAGCTMNEAEFCIHEPEGEQVSPEDIDLVIVPGMAFDTHNHRLGRGKGYYDRLLCQTKAYKLGVCFNFQFLGKIPVDSHDIPMNHVIHG